MVARASHTLNSGAVRDPGGRPLFPGLGEGEAICLQLDGRPAIFATARRWALGRNGNRTSREKGILYIGNA